MSRFQLNILVLSTAAGCLLPASAQSDLPAASEKESRDRLERALRPKHVSAPDVSIEDIVATEPVVLPGSPPLPLRVDLGISGPRKFHKKDYGTYIIPVQREKVYCGDFGSNRVEFIPKRSDP